MTDAPMTDTQMEHIERVHERTEDSYADIEWTPEGRQAHMHRGELIQHVDYLKGLLLQQQLELLKLQATLETTCEL